jgi:hypothetical protein
MSESLLSSDFDILFYNTKIDTIYQTLLQKAFLAGNDLTFPRAPYIQSEKVSGITQSLSLDLLCV